MDGPDGVVWFVREREREMSHPRVFIILSNFSNNTYMILPEVVQWKLSSRHDHGSYQDSPKYHAIMVSYRYRHGHFISLCLQLRLRRQRLNVFHGSRRRQLWS